MSFPSFMCRQILQWYDNIDMRAFQQLVEHRTSNKTCNKISKQTSILPSNIASNTMSNMLSDSIPRSKLSTVKSLDRQQFQLTKISTDNKVWISYRLLYYLLHYTWIHPARWKIRLIARKGKGAIAVDAN